MQIFANLGNKKVIFQFYRAHNQHGLNNIIKPLKPISVIKHISPPTPYGPHENQIHPIENQKKKLIPKSRRRLTAEWEQSQRDSHSNQVCSHSG